MEHPLISNAPMPTPLDILKNQDILPLTISTMSATSVKTPAKTAEKTRLASRIRMEQEMMVMRETDQWICEHYEGNPCPAVMRAERVFQTIA